MRRLSSILALLLVMAAPAGTLAQTEPPRAPAPPRQPSAPPEPPAAVDLAFAPREWRRDIVRVGNDFTLASDDGAAWVTMVAGDLRLEGRVAGDVVVVLGRLDIAPTALIDGSVVVVGGTAVIADGARVRRDFTVVGGRVDAPPTFAPGGNYMLVGPQVFDERFAGVFDWLSRGLLLGRPLVPSLWWMWVVTAVFFLAYLVLGLMFEKPVREVAETLEARPFTTLVVGFLLTLITGPICVLLAVSVVGIAVVPLVIAGVFAAVVLGKIGALRWIGRRVAGAAESPRADAFRSFAIGFVVVTIAYIVPVVGLLTWATLSVFGLGAAALSFGAAYGRESPVFQRAPRAARVPVAAAPVMTPAMAMAGGSDIPIGSMPMDDAAPLPQFAPNDLVTFPKAAFRERLAAGVLDVILLAILVGFFDNLFDENRGFLLALIYFIGFWAWKQTTLGGIICQLRIVRVDNQPIRFVDALVRGLAGIFSLAVLGLGFVWILRDPDRQAWHDRIAGTFVVKVPKNWPL
jgi:uncharacterized RDD family membrane protein YckC